MEIDKRYYLQIFRTQHQELRADVVDYFMAFMRKRNSINRGINVEQIRKHCEYIIKKEIPMDYFLGALLYDGYTPRKIGDQYYLNLSERSPVIAIKNGRTSLVTRLHLMQYANGMAMLPLLQWKIYEQ